MKSDNGDRKQVFYKISGLEYKLNMNWDKINMDGKMKRERNCKKNRIQEEYPSRVDNDE
jgi:predicted DNA-binding WGR domain protein